MHGLYLTSMCTYENDNNNCFPEIKIMQDYEEHSAQPVLCM